MLAPYHLPTSTLQGSDGAGGNLPPALRHALAPAVMAGLHDTILLPVAVAALGCLAALLVRKRAPMTT